MQKVLSFLWIVLRAAAAYIIRPNFRRICRYAAFYKKNEIIPDTILYESRNGASMTCNPYAIFRAIYCKYGPERYLHIWVLQSRNPDFIPEEYRNKKNIRFIRRNTRDYCRWLTQANYLVNNSTFPLYYQKKAGQVYMNTWHGTPLKSMGRDIPGHHTDIKNVQRNFLHADYLLSANTHMTAEMYLRSYQLQGLYEGAVAETGSPRVDLTLHCDRKAFLKRLARAGVYTDRKIILYAPTWKGSEVSQPEVEAETLLCALRTMERGAGGGAQLLLKAHPFLYDALKDIPEVKSYLVPDYLDANELLGVTDVLITDYSSIFFDFLVTGRPVIFYIPDAEKYKKSRGIYFDLNELPGPVCRTAAETAASLGSLGGIRAAYRDKYADMKARFCAFEDGKAADRAANLLLNGQAAGINLVRCDNSRKKILFYGGNMQNNGITNAFINLLNNVDYGRYDVSVLGKPYREPEQEGNMRRLNPDARLICKPGRISTTFAEYICKKFAESFGRWRLYPAVYYRREWDKTFGCAKFDYVVDFSGYSVFWSNYLLAGSGRQIIFQHNDLKSEMDKRINGKLVHRQNVQALLYNYRYYDRIVAVSESLLEENSRNLEAYAPKERYVCVQNSLDFEKILAMAGKCSMKTQNGQAYIVNRTAVPEGYGESLMKAPQEGYANFINMGRLSPEKNHRRLLEAFSIVYGKYPLSRLYITGDGVLADNLTAYAGELNISDAVIFTGFIENPYCLLAKCGCFVLSSDYEGQGLVLLESLILGIPVITTDVTGARSVCANGYGLIVEKSAEGLAGGMEKFIGGELAPKKFDYTAYNREAMSQFYAMLEWVT